MELGPLDHKHAFFANAACAHYAAERITTVDGEHVGWLCPDCDAALPPAAFPRLDDSPGVLGGVAAYWVDEAAELAKAHTAANLLAAGFDPASVMSTLRMTGHLPEECPARVEVTSVSDTEPQYVHGCREV